MSKSKNTLPVLLATLGLIVGMNQSARADAAGDQIAMQLGAIQLGYTNLPYTPSAQDLTNTVAASILKQGQLALAATAANVNTTAFVVRPGTTNRTVVPNPQSSQFRSQYLSAVQYALSNPTLATIPKQTVNTYNPSTKKYVPVANVTGTLSPASTTPTLILSAVVADMPNFASAIVSNAVSATMAGTTNAQGIFVPTWGPVPKPTKANTNSQANINLFNQKTASAQLANAGKAASAALTAASKAYVSGTQNWVAFPKVGNPTNPVSSNYLPNFGITPLGQKGLTNNQQPNLTGLADTAAAVAANAINGLGNVNTNPTAQYGKSATNVTFLSQQLVTAAKAFQANSTKAITGVPNYASGSLGATAFGITTQVAGSQNDSWGGQATADAYTQLLNGVVRGAVTAVGKTSPFVSSIAVGVAQGFAAAYLQTTFNAGGTFVSLDTFLANNVSNSSIAAAFTALGVSGTLFSGAQNPISVGINQAWNSFNQTNGTWNLAQYPMAGAKGINLQLGTNALINGVGTPVTDTTGL